MKDILGFYANCIDILGIYTKVFCRNGEKNNYAVERLNILPAFSNRYERDITVSFNVRGTPGCGDWSNNLVLHGGVTWKHL